MKVIRNVLAKIIIAVSLVGGFSGVSNAAEVESLSTSLKNIDFLINVEDSVMAAEYINFEKLRLNLKVKFVKVLLEKKSKINDPVIERLISNLTMSMVTKLVDTFVTKKKLITLFDKNVEKLTDRLSKLARIEDLTILSKTTVYIKIVKLNSLEPVWLTFDKNQNAGKWQLVDIDMTESTLRAMKLGKLLIGNK